MCIPRHGSADGDDNCPQTNRPKGSDGNYLTSFTTDVPPGWEFMTPAGYTANGTNALAMAPFEVGDYVSYSGHLSTDGNGDFILAHSVIANVGIFTQPGTQPTYVAIDVALMGVGGAPNPNLPQEAATRTRIEGFTTDPSSFVMLSALDVDACTGQPTERFYDMVAVDPGAPTGAVAGRWRWRPNADGFVLPPTRMLRATSINGQFYDWNTGAAETPAGLAAGIYDAPNFEYIFPENLGIGNPPVPSNFQDFPFLVHGSGAYYGANGGEASLGRLGQLDPWPGAAAPVAATCRTDEYGNPLPAAYSPVAVQVRADRRHGARPRSHRQRTSHCNAAGVRRVPGLVARHVQGGQVPQRSEHSGRRGAHVPRRRVELLRVVGARHLRAVVRTHVGAGRQASGPGRYAQRRDGDLARVARASRRQRHDERSRRDADPRRLRRHGPGVAGCARRSGAGWRPHLHAGRRQPEA
jgi:hypothetical protein